MTHAFINRIATAVPDYEVHDYFLQFAAANLETQPRKQTLFRKMADRAGIEHRFSCLAPADDASGAVIDEAGMFRRGAFPGTSARMDIYETAAADLAMRAIDKLDIGSANHEITHLIVASCTGFSAPGLDLEIVQRAGLSASVERTLVGFMGCYAAISGLKLAHHVIRSEPDAKVLVVNCELTTLHLKETTDLEKLLTYCLWGDGCSAALVTSSEEGIRIDRFKALLAPDARDLMTWNVRGDGFEMVLSGQVPAKIHSVLAGNIEAILHGDTVDDIDLWAVHPGGRSVLDAVQRTLNLGSEALAPSREVLRAYGNMSSATVMFVLAKMLETARARMKGCAMAFGPGLTAETMTFRMAS
ncbi:type III polyketide synthase [Roseibium salinum]|uniref:Type III polyketide synthase n=1 Tax=Roseibium salinum TaxID=1604349 RepID=A0ABT3R3G1_9HYPH|nr:type III polyketide synthase [Roseibium sp. DSM 29163]MCX2723739.1 type III polyketide synthase [Roseibium sp. DSM 29163]